MDDLVRVWNDFSYRGLFLESRQYFGELFANQAATRALGAPRSAIERMTLIYLAASTLRLDPRNAAKERCLRFAADRAKADPSFNAWGRQYIIGIAASTFQETRNYGEAIDYYYQAYKELIPFTDSPGVTLTMASRFCHSF